MIEPEIPIDEKSRQSAVDALNIVDTDPEPMYDQITKLVCEALSVPISAVSIVDRQRQYFKSIQGIDVRQTGRDVSFCGHTILTNEMLVVENATGDERFCDNPLVQKQPAIRFYAGVPLHSPTGYRIGSLCAISPEPKKINDVEKGMLTGLASIMEYLLELRHRSVRDPLTGLYNRRFFDETFRVEWRRAMRYNTPVSIMMIDLDHFKSLNDTSGHVAGDAALRSVGKAMAENFNRPGDLVARYGGEEFVAVLPTTPAEGAKLLADHLHKRVAELNIANPGAPNRQLTLSIGVCVLDESSVNKHGFEQVAALELADRALYEAKSAGRNSTVLHLMGK